MPLSARVIGTVVRNTAKRLTSTAGESAAPVATPKASVAVPPWGIVGVGITAAGFFGKMLHDDNLETRRELQATRGELQTTRSEIHTELQAVRREAREDKQELRSDIKALEVRMEAGFKGISDSIAAAKPSHRQEAIS